CPRAAPGGDRFPAGDGSLARPRPGGDCAPAARRGRGAVGAGDRRWRRRPGGSAARRVRAREPPAPPGTEKAPPHGRSRVLRRAVGPGVASALVVLYGVAGPLAGRWLVRRCFVSIVASTAVFGALGA